MTTKRFSELGLSSEVLQAIDRLGFEKASPIQTATIPLLMAGRDVVGQSQTGSGKTAAFGIPAVERVRVEDRIVQSLVLCPTRELAIQVCEDVHQLAFFKPGLHALPIYGGQSYDRQFMGLKKGAQIVIGTPGRLMDHMRRGTIDLGQVRLVVLDEADVMLDMGFREDIEVILKATPAERQTVFFSATMPRPIQDLIQRFAKQPEHVRIEQKTATVPTVEQVYYEVDRRFKLELLTRLIDLHDLRLGIVFCNTKRMVDDLVDHLNAQGYSADGLHGDMGQGMRDRVMNKFRQSGLEFLVATDVAARGIDVDDVQVVFNYDLPYDPEDYVHRIGRTGRAGRSGLAVSFVAGRELFQINQIERYTRTRVRRGRPPSLAEVEEARASAFLERVRGLLLSGEYPRQDHWVERLLEEGFNSTDIASALIHLLLGEQSAPASRPGPADSPRGQGPRERRAEAPTGRRGPTYDGPPGRGPRQPKSGMEPRPSAVGRGVRTAAPGKVGGPAVPAPSNSVAPGNPKRSEPPRGGASDTPPASQASGVPATPKAMATSPEPPEVAPTHAETAPAPGSAEPSTAPVSASVETSVPAPSRDLGPTPSQPPADAAPGETGPGLTIASPLPAVADVPAESKVAGEPEVSGKPVRSIGTPLPRGARQGRPEVGHRAAPFGGKPKPTRATPPEQTRIYMNVGAGMGIEPPDVLRAIQGETGLPAEAVGRIDIRDRHLFVDVASEHAKGIVAKMNRGQIKGLKVKVKLA